MFVLLVLLPPAGIVMVWFTKWSTRWKALASVLSLLWFVLILVSDPEEQEPTGDEKPMLAQPASPSSVLPSPGATTLLDYTGRTLRVAETAARADGYSTVSHDASEGDAGQWDDDNWAVCFQSLTGSRTIDFGVVRTGQPCPERDGEPVPWPSMPDVVGLTYRAASVKVEGIDVEKVTVEGAYTDVTPPTAPDSWEVCFQSPAAGERVEYPKNAAAVLKVTEPGTTCPPEEFTELHPDPVITDDGDPDSSSGDSGSVSGSSAYYPNCAAARAAHAAPLHRGEPGYRLRLDRDGDGIACDR
ncbi:excalibur calcium-binding domain-containing protein [Streptomyces longwoodensis]|uniref:excalibur calcium-binding domain-containing protein n=1 Tax=Streptomyces longwoodensis TaxID=68231 RepID=UPI0036FA64B6